MRTTPGRIINTRTGATIATHIRLADTFATRLQGLQFAPPLASGHALLLVPGGSIHSLFVRAPFDAVFLGRDARVLAITRDIPPWRLRIAAPKHTHAVLELAPEATSNTGADPPESLTLGDHLALVGCAGKPRKSLSFLLDQGPRPAPRTERSTPDA